MAAMEVVTVCGGGGRRGHVGSDGGADQVVSDGGGKDGRGSWAAAAVAAVVY